VSRQPNTFREPFFAEIAQINRLSAPLQRTFQRFFPGINQNEAQIKVISGSKTPIFVPKLTLN
jgi:hypothetical protein